MATTLAGLTDVEFSVVADYAVMVELIRRDSVATDIAPPTSVGYIVIVVVVVVRVLRVTTIMSATVISATAIPATVIPATVISTTVISTTAVRRRLRRSSVILIDCLVIVHNIWRRVQLSFLHYCLVLFPFG